MKKIMIIAFGALTAMTSLTACTINENPAPRPVIITEPAVVAPPTVVREQVVVERTY